MTYCVAIKLASGLVFLSDTLSNAGVDNTLQVRKQFTWHVPGDRAICIMTAGNLGITQAIVSGLNERIDRCDPSEKTILNAGTMFEIAELVGDEMRRVQDRYGPGIAARGADSSASIIVGGQRAGGRPRVFMVYAEGNFIEALDDTPYLQIGEHKYGKPILDRIITGDTQMQDAIVCALLSMDSTLGSNLTVGMPLDLAVLRADMLEFEQQRRIEADDPAFRAISDRWSSLLKDAFGVMRAMPI